VCHTLVKLIVGLGNPGAAYATTKHNVGFWVVDLFGKKHHIVFSHREVNSQIGWGNLKMPTGAVDVLLAKPLTFMNKSGDAVCRLLEIHGISLSDMIVVHDDLDLACGSIRIRTKGRSGGHRGVASIIEKVGADGFLRLKVGIGRDPSIGPSDYVLTRFNAEEEQRVMGGIEHGMEALGLLLEGRIATAMNQFHPLS